jgi:hypothetical protein
VADLVDRLHGIHHFAHQHLMASSHRMKARYDILIISAGFREGDHVWLHHQSRRKSPKLQASCESPYNAITRICDI